MLLIWYGILVSLYRVFLFLLDRLTPAHLSASVASYAARRRSLTVDDRSYTDDHSDNDLYKV